MHLSKGPFKKDFREIQFNHSQKIRTREAWVRSANATSVLCFGPRSEWTLIKFLKGFFGRVTKKCLQSGDTFEYESVDMGSYLS